MDTLKKEFRISIDDYWAWREEDGVEHKRPSCAMLNLDLEPGIHRSVALSAVRSHKTIDDWIGDALDR